MKHKDRFRGQEHRTEVVRAVRRGRFSPAYRGTMVYSLNANGDVYQAMRFRGRPDAPRPDYRHGTAWALRHRGVEIDEFVARYKEAGFKIVRHPAGTIVRYDKNLARPRANVDKDKLRSKLDELLEKLDALGGEDSLDIVPPVIDNSIEV